MAQVRLYVEDDLAPGGEVRLDRARAHYLIHVMRLATGATLALFNGRDGEWRGRIAATGRATCSVIAEQRTRPQPVEPDLWLLFAPVKRARIDFIAEKATELGVSALRPVFTRHTAVERVNARRLRANAIEAAEQCGRLDVPEVSDPAPLDNVVAGWDPARRILLCDESGGAAPVAKVLKPAPANEPGPWAVLTGPEGGFARSELDALGKLPFVYPVALGPRILRADTAAVAALACWQALLGDWRSRPEMGSRMLVQGRIPEE